MTIKQLQKVFELENGQYVTINDSRNQRTIESVNGWCLELSYDYEGFNYEEIDRILSLKVDRCKFSKHRLVIYAH